MAQGPGLGSQCVRATMGAPAVVGHPGCVVLVRFGSGTATQVNPGESSRRAAPCGGGESAQYRGRVRLVFELLYKFFSACLSSRKGRERPNSKPSVFSSREPVSARGGVGKGGARCLGRGRLSVASR